jgi:predicted phosphodiesterase
MKISIASDLHLEFGLLELENKDNADVLVLAGDIVVADRINPKHEWFFENCSNEFKDVIYILGNHEHYHGDFQTTADIMRKVVEPYKNIHFLDNQMVDIDGVTFFGATLWTNMNNRDPIVLNYVGRGMNDFRIITNGWKGIADHHLKLFSTSDAADEFDRSKGFLELLLTANKDLGSKDNKFVVVGHHAPSRKSIHPMYKDETLMNYGYFSDLERFIFNHPEIKLWIHGHMHMPFDYQIGDTRVICNPRGYIGYEPRAHNFKLQTVEI